MSSIIFHFCAQVVKMSSAKMSNKNKYIILFHFWGLLGGPYIESRGTKIVIKYDEHTSQTGVKPTPRDLWSKTTHRSHLGLVCWSLTSLCHSNGHIETMPAREINPFTALTGIRSQFLRTQWSTSNHQRVDMTTPQIAQPSGLARSHLGEFGDKHFVFQWITYDKRNESPNQSCHH